MNIFAGVVYLREQHLTRVNKLYLMSDEEARENLKNNLEYWASLDNTSFKNDFIQLYNIPSYQKELSSMLSSQGFERTYKNAKDSAIKLLESFDDFIISIDNPDSLIQAVDFRTSRFKLSIKMTNNSDVFAILDNLINFESLLIKSISQVRPSSGKNR